MKHAYIIHAIRTPFGRDAGGLAAVRTDDLSALAIKAVAAQALAVTRYLGLADDACVNPDGGAIAIGHPLSASGARLVTTALNPLEQAAGRYALC